MCVSSLHVTSCISIVLSIVLLYLSLSLSVSLYLSVTLRLGVSVVGRNPINRQFNFEAEEVSTYLLPTKSWRSVVTQSLLFLVT